MTVGGGAGLLNLRFVERLLTAIQSLLFTSVTLAFHGGIPEQGDEFACKIAPQFCVKVDKAQCTGVFTWALIKIISVLIKVLV